MFSVLQVVTILVLWKVTGKVFGYEADSKSEAQSKPQNMFDFATEICGFTEDEQKAEGKNSKAMMYHLCGQVILFKQGCFSDEKKRLNSQMLEQLKGSNTTELICNCKNRAFFKGFKLFAVTKDLQCMGFKDTELMKLKAVKKSENCKNSKGGKCRELDDYCIGTDQSQYVYENLIEPVKETERYKERPLKSKDGKKQNKKEKKESGDGTKGAKKGEIVPENFEKEFRWPTGVAVPFRIDPSLEDSRQLILDSLYSIERYTCVRFREMWPHEKIENHILFYQNWDPNRGCSSPLGMMTDGPNEILLSANCISKASVIHETMHTLGFRHEHNRDDRDEYVTIDKTKLTREQNASYWTGKEEHGSGFTGETFGVGYDFNSIMQYPFDAAMSIKDKWKIKCQNHKYGCMVGQPFGLSKSDAYQFNMLFKCPMKSQEGWGCPEYTDSDSPKEEERP